jgi:hypothetical protein
MMTAVENGEASACDNGIGHTFHGINGTTACAHSCREAGHDTILFGNLKYLESEIFRRMADNGSTALYANLELDPDVRYQGVD